MPSAHFNVRQRNEASMADLEPGPPHVDLGGYLLGTLPPADRDTFAVHLAACPDCRRELKELGRLPGLLAQLPGPIEVPQGLEARVLNAIAKEPDRRPPARPPRVREKRPAAPGWRRGWAPAFAAAAVALAFAGGFGVARVFPPRTQPSAAPAETIHLAGVNGYTASGDAAIRRTPAGNTIELTVRGLPPPPAGHFYTCWLVADDDTLQHQDRISVGSWVTSEPPRTQTLRWETAANLDRYPHLGVALEPDNGSPLHQGPKVLTANP
jgi:hypothetical protein